MAIPSGYSRATFYGHLPGGELFNWSLWSNQAPSDQTATQTMATAFATKFQAGIDTPNAADLPLTKIIGSDAGYDGVRVYSYTAVGGHASFVADAPITRPGSSSATGTLPNQCSIVVTLRTAVAGRRATGRIYLPITKYSLGSAGQLDTGSVDGLANAVSHLITALNSAETPQHVGVLSQTAGTFQSVNSVKVDSKVDIQRRRANKQTPAYVKTLAVT